jgi:hypothetical protein
MLVGFPFALVGGCTMKHAAVCFAVVVLVASFAAGQVASYGSSTPFNFSGTLDSGGQLPIVGNGAFKLALRNHPNTFGGAMILGFAPASIPISASILLIDTNGAVIVDLPPGITEMALPVPPIPGLVGYTGYAQAGVFDPAALGNFGLTNGVSVTIMPDRTPTRAYLGGQDFSFGANAPGQMAVLDLSVQPPVFRATGSVGFSGNISDNFPNKVAVSENIGIAYALGNSTTNQFVRVFDVTADPTGVVTHVQAGDIPVAGDIPSSVGSRDMEAMPSGPYLFTVTGSSTATLQVFDVSNAPGIIPTAHVQAFSFPNAGNAVGLELSPNGDRLVLIRSSDSYAAVTIYSIIQGLTPLTAIASIPLPVFTGNDSPSDAHFSPDGRLLFVSAPNGTFAVVDTLTTPPAVLIGNGTWPSGGSGALWFHGNAVAVHNGAPVAIVGGSAMPASYYVIDLNTTAATFGQVLTSFTTNSAGNGNISNMRLHARQSIVMAIDGSGATVDCQMVDVINLAQPTALGYQSWRVKMPSYTNLTPGGLSCIPRDFDLY